MQAESALVDALPHDHAVQVGRSKRASRASQQESQGPSCGGDSSGGALGASTASRVSRPVGCASS